MGRYGLLTLTGSIVTIVAKNQAVGNYVIDV